MTKKTLFTLLLFTLLPVLIFAQGVGINTDNSTADPSAMLDVKSTTKGALVPRMTMTQRDAIATPARSLLIFQIDNTPGYYYFNGATWQPIAGGDADWTVSGVNQYSAVTGNVGIGTSSPTHRVHSYTTDFIASYMYEGSRHQHFKIQTPAGFEKTVLFTEGNALRWKMGMDNAGASASSFSIKQVDDAAPEFVIDVSGNIGIGIAAPTDKLHVVGTSGNTIRIQDGNQAAGRILTSDAAGNASWQAAPTAGSTETASNGLTKTVNDIKLGGNLTAATTVTNNAFALNIAGSGSTTTFASNGNVGIGTAGPSAKLHVSTALSGAGSTNNAAIFESSTGNGIVTLKSSGVGRYAALYGSLGTDVVGALDFRSTTGDISFWSNPVGSDAWTERMRIVNATGNVGIGTTAPSAKLDVVGTTELNGAVAIIDGTQGTGKVLTSDASGNATWVAPAGGSGWETTGNAGTINGTNFIGTTDNQDLDIRTNNVIRHRFTRKGQLEFVNTGFSVFLGNDAGLSDDLTDNNNVFIGENAGRANTSGASNIAIGTDALKTATTINGNIAIGRNALTVNTTGYTNTAIGVNSMLSNLSGYDNTAIGTYALLRNTTGHHNIVVGQEALAYNTTGDFNTAIGFATLSGNTTGSFNTALGYTATVASNNLTNATAIGYAASVNASNKVQIGNTTITDVQLGTSNTVTLETGLIKLKGGAPGTGKVLTSDATGLASWQAAPAFVEVDGSITNEIELPTTANPGDMNYWNGTAWVVVAPTLNEGAALQMIGGVPTWVGGTPPPPPSVTSPTGRVWMDRNLGATQVATSLNDPLAKGSYYQWGRGTDGHQVSNSTTTGTSSPTDVPVDGKFILLTDWRTTQNDNLWQGVGGVNNPCPSANGYRLPTQAEWNAEITLWSQANSTGAFNSILKLTCGGVRSDWDGNIYSGSDQGLYWTSTVQGTNSQGVWYWNAGANASTARVRGMGLSVRCIKD